METNKYSWFRGSVNYELLKELHKMPVVTHKNFAVTSDTFDLTIRQVDGEPDLKVVFLKGKKHFALADLEKAIHDLRTATKL